MADIFLSWGGPDVEPVMALKQAIQSLDLSVWEYREAAVVGQDIPTSVLNAIHDSKISIFCFSDATYDRTWIDRELNWAFSAYRGDISRLIPVWVDAHPQNLRPSLVEYFEIIVNDLHGNREFVLPHLKQHLSQVLHAKPPIEVPAALIAMTAQQSTSLLTQLRANGTAASALRSLCLLLGMPDPPPIIDEWHSRYKARREDFSPYVDDVPMMKIVEEATNYANVWRVRHSKEPVSVRWVHEQLAGPVGNRESDAARDWWEASRPLLVIDSISTLSADIRAEIGELPSFGHAAVLWVPPFTRRTEDTLAPLRESIGVLRRLGDVFRKCERLTAQGAFDSATSFSARMWMQRFFAEGGKPEETDALFDNVRSIQLDKPASGTINGAISK